MVFFENVDINIQCSNQQKREFTVCSLHYWILRKFMSRIGNQYFGNWINVNEVWYIHNFCFYNCTILTGLWALFITWTCMDCLWKSWTL